ncbi:FadR/GntR family transcriptional regulator [Desulfovibrio sp. JC010]|uniref:FadR/GntR family transcriptional regulator n=1 Tax=Desulfovibrio sp. JC010 TaxID=2593641 RepID=UPI0013D657DF|nr:FadR/GntR family transcriptional regulator [Desulfovibrio sp. JC010]NDV28137.1 FadR family transcriptional regulator [Desulfovibrio sp. JC010]
MSTNNLLLCIRRIFHKTTLMKQPLPKIQRKRLSDQVVENLISMIASGELPPGEKLPPEPVLMEIFGVGRSSIREAVGALELIGILSVRPGDGTRVVDSTEVVQPKSVGLSLITIGQDKINELVEARTELEQSIAMLAAQRADSADIEDIRRQHNSFLKTKNRQKLIEADLAFHGAVAHACHNSVLIRFYAEIRQPISLWMEQKAKYEWGFEQVAEDHELILKAIETHDTEAAQSAMRSHIESAGKKLADALLQP